METTLFSLSAGVQPASDDPTWEAAKSQAKSLEQRSEHLVRFSIYEQRLNRTLEKAKAELKQLQQERKQAEEETIKTAAQILKLKKALKQEWDPKQNGFDFSPEQLIAWSDRQQLLQDARYYDLLKRLPGSEQKES